MANTRTVKLIAKLKDNMSSGLKQINVSTAAVAAAFAALSTATIAATKKLADYGAKIFDLSSATGVSIDGIQSLGYAFEQTGGSIDSMSGAIRGLNTFMRTAATGGAEYMAVLDTLGVSYDQLRAMSPEDAFLLLTDRIGGVTNAMERNIAATTVFGGRYAQQVVAAVDQAGGSLRNLTDQFEATGNAMSVDQINTMKAFSDSMTDVGYGAKALAADALVPLMPQLQELIDKALEIGKEVAPGAGTALGGLIDVIVVLTNAFEYVIEKTVSFNASLGTTGEIANWVVNPLGAATGAILEFFDAAAEADRALREWDDAAERAAVTEQAATLITALYADAMTGTADEAAYLIEQLELLESQGANVGDVLDNLRDRHESLTHAELLASLETMTLEENMDGLTQAQVQMAQSAIDAAMAELRLHETIAVGPTVIAAQIAELQRYRNLLDEISGSGGVSASTPASMEGPDKEHEQWQAQQEEIMAGLEARASKQGEIADAAAERYQMETEMAAQLAQQEADAAAALEAERLAALEKASVAVGNFAGSLASAMQDGKKGVDAWFDNWMDRLLQLVTSSAFEKLFKLVFSGAGTGFLGAVGSIFGFTGGSPSVPDRRPYGAAGGMMVPCSPGMQSDGVPIMAKPGEVVLNRSQVNQMGKGGGDVYVTINHSPMFSSASNADIARMVPILKKAITKGGGSWQ